MWEKRAGGPLLRRAATKNFIRRAVLTTKEHSSTDDLDDKLKSEKWLRTEALRLRAEAKRVRQDADARAADLERQAERHEIAAGFIEGSDELPRGNKVRTISRMELSTEMSAMRGPGRPTESDHPFPLAVARAGDTIPAWAERHGYEENRVRSWYRKKQVRGIPLTAAKLIEREFGLRADRSTWEKIQNKK